MKPRNWHIISIVLGVSSVLLRGMLTPQQIETWYSQKVFLFIRKAFDLFNSILPFALIYILLPILLFWLIRSVRKLLKKKISGFHKMVHFLYSTIAVGGVVVFLYMLLFGFNYGRQPIETHLELELDGLIAEQVNEEFELATALLIQANAELEPAYKDSVASMTQTSAFTKTLVEELNDILEQFDYPHQARPNMRYLQPKGVLLRFGTSGVYLPFTGEPHADSGLHPLQIAFTSSHELAHAHGFGDEGTCNFLAYVATINSNDAFIRYAGHYRYWRYVARQRFRGGPDSYIAFVETLPQSIQQDLEDVRAEMQKYPDFLPRTMRDATYNAYLRGQGITEGMENYNRVVVLVVNFRDNGGLGAVDEDDTHFTRESR